MSLWPRLAWFEERSRSRQLGREIYAAIVAQARNEVLFRDMAVPDTVLGRFEMVVAHVALVLGRLQAGSGGRSEGAQSDAARAMLEAFVADMDDTCRRLGIGDMGVPRQVKRAAAAVLERGQAYAIAMSQPPSATADALADVLSQHVWAGRPDDPSAPLLLARYLRFAALALADRSLDDVMAARLGWPDPAACVAPSP